METIKNAVFAGNNQRQDTNDATTESYKQEPISGVQGDTSKGEPFDAGNMEPQSTSNSTSTSTSNPHVSNMGTTTSNSHFNPSSGTEATSPSIISSAPKPTGMSNLTEHKEPATEMQTDTSPTNMATNHQPAIDGDEPKSDVFGARPRRPTTDDDKPKPDASEARPRHPTTDDDKPKPDVSEAGPHHPTTDDDKPEPDVSGPGPRHPTTDDDQPEPDISGPGPRPITQVAKEHGGRMPEPNNTRMTEGGVDENVPGVDASSESSASNNSSLESERDGERHSQTSAEAERAGDRNSTFSNDNKSGNETYMSSGFAATGGNFDAAHPGAGKEALRLMKEPGQHKTFEEMKEEKHHHHKPHLPGHGRKKHSDEHAQPQMHSTKNGNVQMADQNDDGKTSMGEKIKKKLHIGHSGEKNT